MTACCGTGALSKLSIGATGGSLTRMDFISFTPTRTVKTLSDGSRNVIRGTLDHGSTAATEGIAFVEFRISMHMTAAKNDILLPLMGLAESPTDTFTLADALPEAKVVLTPYGGKDFTYDNIRVSRWFVHGRKGGDPIRLDIDFVGKNWTEAASGTYTHGSIVEGYTYGFTQGSMTLESATRYFNQFRLGLDYGLITEHNNSVYATNICPTDHNLTFGTGVLYSTCDSTTDLYTTPMTSSTAATGSQLVLGFTRDTLSTQFTVGNVKLIPRPPQISKTDFNRLPIYGQGYAVGSSPMLVVTNDATV